MKVLFDIALLGLGHFDSRARSGIFRVVENLAKEMVKMPDCDVSFCSFHDLKLLFQALEYCKTIPEFSDTHFVRLRNGYMRKKKYLYEMSVLENKLNSGEINSPVLKLITQIKYQQARVFQKLYSYGNEQTVPLTAINNTDIYHTPFFPISEAVQNAKVKARFVSCYDLIPIYKPEFCHEETISRMVKFLDKINSETWILCISQSARNELLNYMGNRVDPAKAIVTELAASAQFYRSTNKLFNASVRKRYGIPEGQFILSICTLEPRKNLDRLISAFEQLVRQQHLSDLSLVLVGNKGLKWNELMMNVKGGEAITKRIIITGYVADADLAALYTEAIMFAYPSLYEGFGLPPLEAMQCGTPVITSNATSLPEVVGDAGIMINPEDTDALTEGLWKLYSQPQLRLQLSEKAILRAKQFSWKRCATETVAAYKLSLQS